jgi:hypothetical protein
MERASVVETADNQETATAQRDLKQSESIAKIAPRRVVELDRAPDYLNLVTQLRPFAVSRKIPKIGISRDIFAWHGARPPW